MRSRPRDLGISRFTPGWDFVRGNSFPDDPSDHGTIIAALLGEDTNNATDMAGLAYNAKIMPIRVLDLRPQRHRPTGCPWDPLGSCPRRRSHQRQFRLAGYHEGRRRSPHRGRDSQRTSSPSHRNRCRRKRVRGPARIPCADAWRHLRRGDNPARMSADTRTVTRFLWLPAEVTTRPLVHGAAKLTRAAAEDCKFSTTAPVVSSKARRSPRRWSPRRSPHSSDPAHQLSDPECNHQCTSAGCRSPWQRRARRASRPRRTAREQGPGQLHAVPFVHARDDMGGPSHGEAVVVQTRGVWRSACDQ